MAFNEAELLEIKRDKRFLFTITSLEKDDISKFSSILNLERKTAYILRFYNNCKAQLNSQPKQTGEITTEEINIALLRLIKISQNEYFGKEINKLRNKGTLIKNSKLISLNPFLDNNGILRVGGRLSNARFAFEKKTSYYIVFQESFSLVVGATNSF